MINEKFNMIRFNIISVSILFVVISFVILLISTCGITDEEKASNALKSMSFKEIKFTGYKAFACGKGDWYHTGFEAINRDGMKVYGTVCSGLYIKNSTVRFE